MKHFSKINFQVVIIIIIIHCPTIFVKHLMINAITLW